MFERLEGKTTTTPLNPHYNIVRTGDNVEVEAIDVATTAADTRHTENIAVERIQCNSIFSSIFRAAPGFGKSTHQGGAMCAEQPSAAPCGAKHP